MKVVCLIFLFFYETCFWNRVQEESLKEMIKHIMHHELKQDFENLVRNTVSDLSMAKYR